MKNTPQNDEFIRKRIARQKKIRKRRIITGSIFTIILLLVVGAVLCLTVFFPIASLTANGSDIYTPEQIIAASGIEKGDNLFVSTVSLKNLRKKLPFIEKLNIERTLPDTMKITVKDATEYACYFSNNKYYSVSREGYVLKEYAESPEGIFEIKAQKVNCKPGEKAGLSTEKQNILVDEVCSQAEKYNLRLNAVDITDELNLIIRVEDRFSVELGSSNNLSNKFAHLEGMIKNIDSDKKGKINLSMWTSQNTEGTFIEEKPE